MERVLDAAKLVWRQTGAGIPTVTSGNDSIHNSNSRHYDDSALDLRTRDVPGSFHPRLAQSLAETLGTGYVVILESDHIHVQFD